MEQTSPLYIAASKLLPDYHNVEYCMELLSRHPEGVWFRPTNVMTEEYTVCVLLAELAIIALRRTPKWHDGSYHGYKYEFMYNSNLKY